MQISFRPATSRDLDSIYQVEKRAFPEQAWPKDAFVSALSDPGNEFRLAESGQRPLGYILLDKGSKGPGTTRVNSLGVDPDTRGQKIGEQLFLWALERSSELGANRVELEVEIGNAPAEKLYAKYGFAPTKILSGYYGPGKDGQEMVLEDLQNRKDELRQKREALLAALGGFPSAQFRS